MLAGDQLAPYLTPLVPTKYAKCEMRQKFGNLDTLVSSAIRIQTRIIEDDSQDAGTNLQRKEKKQEPRI